MAKQRLQPLDFAAEASPALDDPAPTARDGGLVAAAAPGLPVPQAAGPSASGSEESGRLVWLAAAAASVLWVGGVSAFALSLYGARGVGLLSVLDQATLALLAIGPVALIVFCALVLRQAGRLAAHNARAAHASERLLSPALLAAAQAGGALETVRAEIDAAAGAADQARASLGSLAELLSVETHALGEAAEEALRTARSLADTVSGERDHLAALGRRLDDQAAAVVESVTRQARMVSEAAELAAAQISDAETALAARTGDLAAAAGEATDAARAAGGDLSRQTQRLETASRDLADNVRTLETGLSTQRAALVDLGRSIAGEQDAFAAKADADRRQLGEALTLARQGAQEIGEVSAVSGQALQALVASVASQMQDAAEALQIERDRIEARARDSVAQLGDAADAGRARIESGALGSVDALRAAAAEAAEAAEAQAEAARSRVEQLSEAAFAAGRQADEAFESRLAAARRMIDQSAGLVDEAGERSSRSLAANLDVARSAIVELSALLADVDARAAALPAAAQAQVVAVREAVEQGVAELQAAARAAAAETEAVDLAFQDRLRRNQQALSEAVRLMGSVTAVSPSLAPVQPDREPAEAGVSQVPPAEQPPQLETHQPDALYDEAVGSGPDAPEDERDPSTDEALFESEPAAAEPQAFTVSVAKAGLRPRIRYLEEADATAQDDPDSAAVMRLPPSASHAAELVDAAPEAPLKDAVLFEEAEPQRSEEVDLGEGASSGLAAVEDVDESLFIPDGAVGPGAASGRELLQAAGQEPQADEEALADRLATELHGMSIDPERLLPRGRVDEIAVVVHAGDRAGARAVVCRLAPAAVRRLARRLATDPALRSDAAQFLRMYASLLSDASLKDHAGYMTGTLLGSEAGRVWLLFDAAEET